MCTSRRNRKVPDLRNRILQDAEGTGNITELCGHPVKLRELGCFQNKIKWLAVAQAVVQVGIASHFMRFACSPSALKRRSSGFLT